MSKKNFRLDPEKLKGMPNAFEKLENSAIKDMGENVLGGLKPHSQTHSQSGSGHSQTHSQSTR
ncbi:MAG: hypothetical protein J0L86_01220 [Flavobacteriales bacterium]|nr:hypothetical protein [Flavobacteriales bacterium]